MFKKFINHDKSKLKNDNDTKGKSNGVAFNDSKTKINGTDKSNNNIMKSKLVSKQEKETTQHVENAGDNIEETDQVPIPAIEEDPADLVPFTDDPNLPFGDGSNKIFGMENFGNTCYCNSVLQVLYYTTPFRQAILTFPERDPNHLRRRRLNVAGEKTHAFVQLQFNQANAPSVIQEQPQEEEPKPEKRRTSIFGMGKMGKLNGSSSNNTTVPSSSSGSATMVSTLGASTNGNGLTDFNTSNTAINNPHLIDKTIANRYPALKTIKPMYQLNQQRTLSILGDTEDASSNTEKRKRHALLQGPIINLDHLYNDTYGMQKNLFTTLKDIFECMVENKSQTGIVSPQKLIEVLKEENELFRSSMHQDAHEFLNFLVNCVLEVVDTYNFDGTRQQDERNPSTTSTDAEKRLIHEIFEGLLTSETQCLCCERTSTRDEKFLDLSIDLTASSSITKCLKQFSQSEMLQEQNKFYCDSCHSLQELAKTIRLKKSPKILALHLKRFKYSEEYNRNMKLFYRVTYPKNLRLFNTTTDTETPDKLYQLYAVVVHIGGGPHHGHYISLIKTENFGWLLFDDEVVESIDENYVFKFFGDGPGLATLYVLFYKEMDEMTNINNNLYNGFELDDDSSTTLDVNFNQMTGHLNERLNSMHIRTPNESISDSKRSDENSGDSNSKIVPSSESSFFDPDFIHHPVTISQPPTLQLLQTPPLSQLSRKSSIGGNSVEKRKSKMFGWKKS